MKIHANNLCFIFIPWVFFLLYFVNPIIYFIQRLLCKEDTIVLLLLESSFKMLTKQKIKMSLMIYQLNQLIECNKYIF